MFRHLPPSRTFTIAAMGVWLLSLHGIILLVAVVGLLWRHGADANTTAVVNALLGVTSTVVLAITACSAGGAGGLALRDSISKGATTSGAQLVAMRETPAATYSETRTVVSKTPTAEGAE